VVTYAGSRPTQPASSGTNLNWLVNLVLYLIIIAVILGIIVFVLRWLLDKKDKRRTIYTEDFKKVAESCKLQKEPDFIKGVSIFPKSFMSVGTPVLLSYPPLTYSKEGYEKEIAETSKAKETKEQVPIPGGRLPSMSAFPGRTYKLGSYAGSCTTSDGCWNLMIKSSRMKVMGLFPKMIIIKLRLPHDQKYMTTSNETNKKTDKRHVPPDCFTRSSEFIIISTLSIEPMANGFYYCVNKDGEGRIVDTKAYVYHDMIEVATQRQVADFGRNMVTIADDLAKGSPIVQMTRKTDTGLTGD